MYKVILIGIRSNIDILEVVKNLSVLFKIRTDQVEKLFENSEYTIKTGLILEVAMKYKVAIESTGANCRIDPEAQKIQIQETVIPLNELETIDSIILNTLDSEPSLVVAQNNGKQLENIIKKSKKNESHFTEEFKAYAMAVFALIMTFGVIRLITNTDAVKDIFSGKILSQLSASGTLAKKNSQLESVMAIGFENEKLFKEYEDKGGLNFDSSYNGIKINELLLSRDKDSRKLTGYTVRATYKDDGVTLLAPIDVRKVLNTVCKGNDSQWEIKGSGNFLKSDIFDCFYGQAADGSYELFANEKKMVNEAKSTNLPNVGTPELNTASTQSTGFADNDVKRNTRYGTLRFINKNDKITLYLNDQIFASVDANSINGFNQSFVVNDKDIVVFSSVAGGGCGTYQFISVVSQTNASMSQSFYSCGEIVFEQNNSKIITESMDYLGENKKQVIYENGVITENNRNVPIKVNGDSCVEDKVKLFERRFEAKVSRTSVEGSLKGEEFHLSAVRMSEIQDDARKTAVASCAIEKDAIVTGIPSFDCSKTNQRIEQTICSNRELAALDVKLSNSFKSVRYFSKNKDAFLADSREWLAKRQECQDAACLVGMYKNRLTQLQKIAE
jgi:uncharacterized protein YecT (DUF1311 family)